MEHESMKPCPFCGGEAEMREGSSTKPYVRCKRCGCRTGSSRYRGNVARAWNARAAVDDEQFAMAVHDGKAWQRVRECRMSHARGGGWYCSECGVWVAPGPMANATEYLAPQYCPNCGAKVTNEEEVG